MEIKEVYKKLREVIDPEIGYDIVSLGEVEEVRIENNKVYVKILPTTPLCPYLPFIIEGVNEKIKELGLDPEIDIDFENQWSFDRVDPEIRKRLGI